MKICKILIIFCFLAAYGCSSVKHNYSPKISVFKLPAAGVEISAGIGEPLIDQGRIVERDVLFVTSPATVAFYKIKAAKFLKTGDDNKYEYFIQDLESGFSIYSEIISTPSPESGIRLNKLTGEYCIVRPSNFPACLELKTKRKKESSVARGSFRRTLIYTGRVGDKLKISYREFSGDMARPAFNSDVEYDLNASSIIGYAGAELEIISATNTLIKYKLIKNFPE